MTLCYCHGINVLMLRLIVYIAAINQENDNRVENTEIVECIKSRDFVI